MPTEKIVCPTEGCEKTLNVKFSERGRPSIHCKLPDGCGFTGLVTAKKGVKMWQEGTGKVKKQNNPEPASKAADKTEGRDFKFPFE